MMNKYCKPFQDIKRGDLPNKDQEESGVAIETSNESNQDTENPDNFVDAEQQFVEQTDTFYENTDTDRTLDNVSEDAQDTGKVIGNEASDSGEVQMTDGIESQQTEQLESRSISNNETENKTDNEDQPEIKVETNKDNDVMEDSHQKVGDLMQSNNEPVDDLKVEDQSEKVEETVPEQEVVEEVAEVKTEEETSERAGQKVVIKTEPLTPTLNISTSVIPNEEDAKDGEPTKSIADEFKAAEGVKLEVEDNTITPEPETEVAKVREEAIDGEKEDEDEFVDSHEKLVNEES